MLAKAFVPPDPVVYNHLMWGFVKKGDPDKIVSLYEELLEKLGGEIILDGIVYGNLMKGYFAKGMEKDAMETYHDILGEGSKVRFGAVSYNQVLDALGRNGKLEEAIELFDRMLKEHDPPRSITVNLGTSFNVMADAYCLAGRFQDAITVFGRMGEQKCTPDALSYNNLIEQLGSNKLVAEADELYKEMDDGVTLSQEMKELVEEALRREGRDEEMGKLYEDVSREKAERLAREAEEKARAEALATEEEGSRGEGSCYCQS
ncbi:Pentatricopeptide repeat-containing protein [Musa troglodytarum]|uniref:Pentatricopeptide repeat-containing protein n=1 Tax=Musa troglodytarum TaxID=320322 RepID=A0A9E7L821_9LILI|nr:Pentatricopeptide repeat-containing protein [Musa troglodytarum]